jgi:hypothetical protein
VTACPGCVALRVWLRRLAARLRDELEHTGPWTECQREPCRDVAGITVVKL